MRENFYEFVTFWRFDAPVEAVWNEIENVEAWSDWWRGVLKVEKLKDGDADGIGKIIRTTWKSFLPYKLIFDSEVVRFEKLKLVEARAFGQLDGIGIWTLTAENENTTRVRYDWKVKTTKAWMNFFAPVAKPFFKWNHDYIMNRGGKGLARKLGCRMLESKENLSL